MREFTLQRSLIIGSAVAAGIVGLVVQHLYSAALDTDTLQFHAIGLLFGGAAAVALSRISFALILKVAGWVYTVGLISLLLLFTPLGVWANGAPRVIDFGLFMFDPRPLALVAFIPVMAKNMAKDEGELFGIHLPHFALVFPFGSGFALVLPLLLCFLLAVSFQWILMAMYILGGTAFVFFGLRRLHTVFGLATVFAVSGLLIIKSPHRLQRLMSFTDPLSNSDGSGFAHVSAWTYLAHFRAWEYTPADLKYYLSGHLQGASDFVVVTAVVFGGLPLLFLAICPVMVLAWVIARASGQVAMPERAAVLLAVALMFSFGVMLNLAHVCGLFPGFGVQFPFISAGASGLVAVGVAVGLALAALQSVEHPD